MSLTSKNPPYANSANAPAWMSPSAIEEAILGACLIDARAIGEVMEIFQKLNPFYSKENAHLYSSLKEMYSKNIPIDLNTVSEHLRKRGLLEEVGGDYRLMELFQKVISSAHLEYHCRILLQYFIKRSCRNMAFETLKMSENDETDCFDILEQAQSKLEEISRGLDAHPIDEYWPIAIEAVRRAANIKKGEQSGVPSSIEMVNKNIFGWQKSDLVILAARPGMGKTALALQEACFAADAGFPVAFFSLEMSKEQLAMRLVSYQSDVPLQKIRHSGLEEVDINRIFDTIKKVPLYIDDSSGLDPLQLRIKAKRLQREKGIKLIVIDYLQLMHAKGHNREQEISSISRSLKMLAKELDVPVIALSQLSRAVETRGGSKRPQLSDLRDSGAIEQDADIVLFLYRPEYYDHPQWDQRYQNESCLGQAELMCEKHRNGGLFYNRVHCDLSRMKFMNLSVFDPISSSW